MSDGFQLVKSKRNRKTKYIKGNSKPQLDVDCIQINEPLFIQRIEESLNELTAELFKISTTIKESFPHLDNILCYGLGSFSNCRIARTQLATLIYLKKHFNCTVIAYDPIFTPSEVLILNHFDISTAEVNEEGKHKLKPKNKTLAFFPHCPKQLVNNFLWSNWCYHLYDCVIISNSFTNIIERNTKTDLSYVKCISDINEITNEVAVPTTEDTFYAFSDLSIHTFHASKLPNEQFWLKREEPIYSFEDLEFVTREISTKLKNL